MEVTVTGTSASRASSFDPAGRRCSHNVCQSWTPGRAVRQRGTASRCRGLLDSYRQEQSHQTTGEERKKPPRRTRHPRPVTESRGCGSGEDDDALCTPECVREIFTAAEFNEALETANPNTLVVVDFYKTACGSCRYIQPGFVKLCHNSEEEHAPVTFLKHNIIDDADQETDLGEHLRIRNVPLFQFYRDKELLQQFATREKTRIGEAINSYVGRDVCHL